MKITGSTLFVFLLAASTATVDGSNENRTKDESKPRRLSCPGETWQASWQAAQQTIEEDLWKNKRTLAEAESLLDKFDKEFGGTTEGEDREEYWEQQFKALDPNDEYASQQMAAKWVQESFGCHNVDQSLIETDPESYTTKCMDGLSTAMESLVHALKDGSEGIRKTERDLAELDTLLEELTEKEIVPEQLLTAKQQCKPLRETLQEMGYNLEVLCVAIEVKAYHKHHEMQRSKRINNQYLTQVRDTQPRYTQWHDTEESVLMYKVVSGNHVDALQKWIDMDPSIAFIRSKDGRGPMWWALEYKFIDIVKVLKEVPVPYSDVDAYGLNPFDLLYRRKLSEDEHYEIWYEDRFPQAKLKSQIKRLSSEAKEMLRATLTDRARTLLDHLS